MVTILQTAILGSAVSAEAVLGCTARIPVGMILMRIALTILPVAPIAVCCVLLNRYIFKSADMIDGAING